MQITVLRGGVVPEDKPDAPSVGGEEVTITVQPQPKLSLGLVMEKGQIVAVQEGTEAAKKGIQPGDFIDEVSQADNSTAAQAAATKGAFDDPMAWPDQLRKLADQNRAVRLKLRRSLGSEGRQTPDLTIDLPLRRVTWIEQSWNTNAPLSIPSLGIAYRVLNRIDEVQPDSPASRAGLQSSDVITKAEFVLPESSAYSELGPIEFGEEGKHNWPAFMEQVQILPSGTEIKLTLNRGDQTKEVTLAAEPMAGEFVPTRGFNFQRIQRIRTANSLGEQISLGYDETIRSLTLVFRFLNKLVTGQVPATSLGGPVTIAKAAGYSAFDGIGKLLVFLTILSANLAVINFMPIPLLDGGHMVFLTYEGIRGRPASEKFVVAMHTVGFVFIISLMLFVLSLDFGLIDRNL